MNPLDWNGPNFLLFYIGLLPVALSAAYLLRRAILGPHDWMQATEPRLDVYQIAYLAGGAPRVLATALGSLVQHGALEVAGQKLFATRDPAKQSAHAIEQAVVDEAHESASPASLRGVVERACVPLRQGLEHDELVVERGTAFAAQWQPLLLALLVPALGVVKIAVGISRGRPVGFLVLLCIASVVVALFMFGRRPLRTGRGDRVLARLKDAHQALRVASKAQPAWIERADLALAMALFSLTAIHTPQVNSLREVLGPQGTGSLAGWGYGGCGVSSCSTGGGGSGCGGGGCGGCSA